ncbi:hypothetical protein AB7254_01285 [Providencia rettgeri]
MLKQEKPVANGYSWFVNSMLICIGISIAIGAAGRLLMLHFQGRTGLILFIFIAATYIISKLAFLIHENVNRSKYTIAPLYIADVATITTLSLNLDEELVKNYPELTSILTGIYCFNLLFVTLIMTEWREENNNVNLGKKDVFVTNYTHEKNVSIICDLCNKDIKKASNKKIISNIDNLIHVCGDCVSSAVEKLKKD